MDGEGGGRKNTMKTKYIIIHGAPGTGKTLNAHALRLHYKCDFAFDAEFNLRLALLAPKGARVLLLAHSPNPKLSARGRRVKALIGARVIPLEKAKAALGAQWRTRPPLTPTPPAPSKPADFISRDEVRKNQDVFLDALNRAIEFHRTNTNDPHNVGASVMVAVTEVRDAFKAYMLV
jgi:hypothetical protein